VPNANLRRDASDTHNSVPILGVSDSGISVLGDRHDLQNTRTVILNAHDDAALTEPVVSRPANDPAETPTDQAASKIPHRTPRNHKDTNPQTRAVRITITLPSSGVHLSPFRLMLGQQSPRTLNLATESLHSVHLENRHRRHKVPHRLIAVSTSKPIPSFLSFSAALRKYIGSYKVVTILTVKVGR
jgi:hypothetical protein